MRRERFRQHNTFASRGEDGFKLLLVLTAENGFDHFRPCSLHFVERGRKQLVHHPRYVVRDDNGRLCIDEDRRVLRVRDKNWDQGSDKLAPLGSLVCCFTSLGTTGELHMLDHHWIDSLGEGWQHTRRV